MKNPDNFQQAQQHVQLKEAGSNDLQFFIALILKNWYWFLIAIGVALFCVRYYVGHTLPVYRTSATILINETSDRPALDNSELLMGLGLPGGMKNLQNQIMILKSRELTERTLRKLSFETEFYFRSIRNKLPIYPEVPVEIISENEIPLPKDTEFSISFIDKNTYILESESKTFQLQKTAALGDTLEIRGTKFMIVCNNVEWLRMNSHRKLYFTINSMKRLIGYFSSRINVELLSREGSVLQVSITGTNPAKDVAFLNNHIEGFQAISLEKKNTEAERRVNFIDNQLVGITDSLLITENRLQQFRSSHRVMDLSAQGQAIIAQINVLENEKARLNLEANYYDYLAEYLAKEASGEVPIVPITMGINDPGLTRLVGELAELQGQLSSRGAGEMNPLQRNLEQRVLTAKASLRETLNGLRRANSLARSENQEQINRANSQASALPVTERQLLGIERKFNLNDELYTFLLETRATQEMQKASNRADSEVIDSADMRFSSQISPDPIKLNMVAFFAGFGIPFLIIYLRLLFNKKLKNEDIKKLKGIPVVGYIKHNTEKTDTVVYDSPNSTIAESFRLLRSRMQFLTKEASSPVILVTSAMPNDGKTFTAVNLAAVYTLLGKKTVLIGFDLRKPKLSKVFKISDEKGVSTWLIGKDSLKDIIQESPHENLSVISAGPLPPNPSELTALGKTEELLLLLKERYDYIIIDSSPIGYVSDTFHLASLSDACLLVVRPEHTLRDIFENTINEIFSSGIKGVSLIINDIQSGSKHYGYGEKYGYTNDKKRSKKHLFKRNKIKQ